LVGLSGVLLFFCFGVKDECFVASGPLALVVTFLVSGRTYGLPALTGEGLGLRLFKAAQMSQ
jgi:hypothetical protein